MYCNVHRRYKEEVKCETLLNSYIKFGVIYAFIKVTIISKQENALIEKGFGCPFSCIVMYYRR